jgi:hypothetical protein
MADVMESYPDATTGSDVPTVLVLLDASGNDEVNPIYTHLIPNTPVPAFTNEYTLTLSLSSSNGHFSSCQLEGVTADRDLNPQAFDPIPVRFTSNGAGLNTPNTHDIMESYPASTSGGLGDIVEVTDGGFITAVAVGQAIVECYVPIGNGDDLSSGCISASIIVTVTL